MKVRRYVGFVWLDDLSCCQWKENVRNALIQGGTVLPPLICMNKLIKLANLKGKVALGLIYYLLLLADDLALLHSAELELQNGIRTDLEAACTNFGISCCKIQVMHFGVNRMQKKSLLERVSELKYLGCMFSEDGEIDREIWTEYVYARQNEMVENIQTNAVNGSQTRRLMVLKVFKCYSVENKDVRNFVTKMALMNCLALTCLAATVIWSLSRPLRSNFEIRVVNSNRTTSGASSFAAE